MISPVSLDVTRPGFRPYQTPSRDLRRSLATNKQFDACPVVHMDCRSCCELQLREKNEIASTYPARISRAIGASASDGREPRSRLRSLKSATMRKRSSKSSAH